MFRFAVSVFCFSISLFRFAVSVLRCFGVSMFRFGVSVFRFGVLVFRFGVSWFCNVVKSKTTLHSATFETSIAKQIASYIKHETLRNQNPTAMVVLRAENITRGLRHE